MLHSAEIRWFYPGSLPKLMLRWFAADRMLSPATRTDRYLVFPGCESVGVKVREGRFEIKALKGASETVRFSTGISARTDCWVKWSYGKESVKPWIEALLGEHDGWIDVTKARYLRKYSLDGGEILEVDAEELLDRGCNVELTRVSTRDRAWWSLAFEAFGSPDLIRGDLQKVVGHFFTDHPPAKRFEAMNSCSYPVWLASL
jgi:hypothetical protein